MTDHQPTFDAILDLCRNRQRRIILAMLITEQQSVTLDELSRAVLNYEHHTPPEVTDDVLAETRTALHHIHLPKLASERIITYNPDEKHVEVAEQLAEVQPVISTILDAEAELEVSTEPS